MMNQNHPTIEELVDYLHRELTPEADAALLVHLEACPDCAARYEEQAQLSESLRAYARASERDVPQGVIAGIWDTIERETARPAWHEQLVAFFRPAYALPVAAILLLAIFFGYNATHRGAPVTTIDAAVYLRDHASLNSTMPFGEGAAEPASLRDDATVAADQRWVASTGTSVVAESR